MERRETACARFSAPFIVSCALTVGAPAVSAQHPPACGTALSAGEAARAIQRSLEGGYAPPPGLSAHQAFVVPVTLHVVRRSNGTGGLSSADLERTFLDARAALAPALVELCRPGETNYIDDDQLFDCVCGADIDLLRSTDVVPGTVNVYFAPEVVASGGTALCGISSFTFSGTQGIVMRNSCTAEGDNASTLAHELGHYFDLYHTHETAFGVECADGSNCTFAGDQVCDTPADPQLGSGNVGLDCAYLDPPAPACNGDSGLYEPDTTNYMSYSHKHCRTRFSPGQVGRMRATLVNLRPELALASCPDLDSEPAPGMSLVSAAPAGGSADGRSQRPAISRDGRYVAFHSAAPDILPSGPSVSWDQVYVRDLWTGEIERVSVNDAGEPANSGSRNPAISADGRYVAFSSTAFNLAPEDTGNMHDVYVHDRQMGTTELISVTLSGGGANASLSTQPAISDDGRYVAFASRAPNLVPGVDTTSLSHVYLADRVTRGIELVSVNDAGEPGISHSVSPAISADGRFVAFASSANNLDPNDQNSPQDVFLRDRQAGTTRLVSADSQGAQGFGFGRTPSISADGRFVAFELAANGPWPNDPTNFTQGDIVVKDTWSGALELVSLTPDGAQAVGDSFAPAIAADGTRVAFVSDAGGLLDPEEVLVTPQVFVHDLTEGSTVIVSTLVGQAVSAGAAETVAVEGAGRLVAFSSSASDLVEEDENGQTDVFLMDLDAACAMPAESLCGSGKSAPCPCGNPGADGEGCAGSAGRGAQLSASGSVCVDEDALMLSVEGAGLGGPALLLQGDEAPPAPMQDGLSCLGGQVRVLEALVIAPDGTGTSSVSIAGDAEPGRTRTYQLWYRDPAGPCGHEGNFSQALRVRWR